MKRKSKLLISAGALAVLLGLNFTSFSDNASARPDIVKDGKPNAEIIISDKPTRSMKMAASELQANIQKISGAKLPITTVPNKDVPVKIYVGKSTHTDALGIKNEGLKHGAFRMVSGDKWLALVGIDDNYVFKEPYAKSPDDGARVQAEWERITGAKWLTPYGTSPLRHYNKELDLWYLDERGSVNAVYRFLNDLGMRWYMPGELGEIVPDKKTIPLSNIDKTVRPDFALRELHSRATFSNTSEALWTMRLGRNIAPDIVGPYITGAVAHGMTKVGQQPGSRANYPEFFAIINGKRFMPEKNPSFCLSSKELLDQNVRYLRAVFDVYNPLMVSVQPADSNVLVCQCEKCAGKGTPERGRRGDASDYVWEYIDRVAREVYKTHPNNKIAALAYANYQLPPTKIATLSPNIIVGTPSGRTFTHNDPQETELIRKITKEWLDKLPEGSKQIYHYEYFMDARPGRRTENLPVFVTGSVAQSLRDVKGVCIGEHIDVERYRDSLIDLGVMHLNLYVTSKLWWDADQDLKALLEEYYTLYYGPAREQMKKVIEYAEAHWTEMPSNPETIKTYFTLLAEAQAAVPADSVYGKRIDLMWQYTKPMKSIVDKLAQPRDESIPPVLLGGTRPPIKLSDIKIDGKMDEKVWQNLPGKSTPEHLDLATYQLRDIVTGAKPVYPTTFKTFWAEGSLYMGIRCEDPDAKNLNIATRTRDDAAIWNGDLIELHLETQNHSYYALVINPAGTLVDLDWKDKKRETAWNSKAEVATQIDDKGWTIEIRIPVVDEQEAEIVELGKNGVMGRQPTKLYPWYMNLIRQRVRGTEKECSAYSPTGTTGFHNPAKFARLSSKK
jgi:hypothetical protein